MFDIKFMSTDFQLNLISVSENLAKFSTNKVLQLKYK